MSTEKKLIEASAIYNLKKQEILKFRKIAATCRIIAIACIGTIVAILTIPGNLPKLVQEILFAFCFLLLIGMFACIVWAFVMKDEEIGYFHRIEEAAQKIYGLKKPKEIYTFSIDLLKSAGERHLEEIGIKRLKLKKKIAKELFQVTIPEIQELAINLSGDLEEQLEKDYQKLYKIGVFTGADEEYQGFLDRAKYIFDLGEQNAERNAKTSK